MTTAKRVEVEAVIQPLPRFGGGNAFRDPEPQNGRNIIPFRYSKHLFQGILRMVSEKGRAHSKALGTGRRIDSITFSGSGEPTLNTQIGWLIREIKSFTDTPVTVLTNATTLPDREVQEALLAADRVVPSLDAASQEVFEKINRPAPGLKIVDIIEGLAAFRRRFSGEVWLEILLVKGLNDSEEHLLLLKSAAEKIGPDRIQLNTVVRPPSDPGAKPLSQEKMEEIRSFFGDRAEIIADFSKEEPIT